MPRRTGEHALFFREFLRNYRSTGAILPSGRCLARALTRYVADGAPGSRRILEVGPGTGAVTQRIVRLLRAGDQLDLVELNESFVRRLHQRLATQAPFRRVADRTRVWHCGVEELPGGQRYDVILSGLPLNNFAAEEVARILGLLRDRLRPAGTLSFFEYIAVRRLRGLVGGAGERARLRAVGRALTALLERHEIRREGVWPNVPPAWVHHVRV